MQREQGEQQRLVLPSSFGANLTTTNRNYSILYFSQTKGSDTFFVVGVLLRAEKTKPDHCASHYTAEQVV